MPLLPALQRGGERARAGSALLRSEDASELFAGAERPRAFNESLQLVARAHEEELRQLKAQNAKLMKRLAEMAHPDGASDKRKNDGTMRRAETTPLEHSTRRADSTPILPGSPQDTTSVMSDTLLAVPMSVVPVPAGNPPPRAWSKDASSNPEQSPASEDTLEGIPRPQEEPPSLGVPAELGSTEAVQPPPRPPSSFSRSERSRVPSRRGEDRFPLSDVWESLADGPASPVECSSVRIRKSRVSVISSEDEPRRASRFISYPSSPGRLLWDLVGALLIFYDLITIPLESFDPPRNGFTTVAGWFTLMFWTLNIPMSIQVGFVVDGVTIMDFGKIVVHYLKTWFIIDIAVVLPDWVFTLTSLGSEDGGNAGGVRLLRTLRLIRLVRLVRLLKLPSIMQSLSEFIETEYTNILANIAKMIVLLLMINHYIGCLWFLIGSTHEGIDTWVVYHSFKDADWGYQYLTSFHWAITQFTPASMHIQPQNPVERGFAIFVVVFALVGFSYIVGSIMGSLTQLRSMQEDMYKQFWILRRYLKQNRVPMQLSGRIQRYLEHAWNSQRQTMTLQNSKLFCLLSDQLQAELQYEICLPSLRLHELFDSLSTKCPTTMRRIAWNAIHPTQLAEDDHLFIPGENATHMYILVSGCMEYVKSDDVGEDVIPLRVQNSEACKVFIAEPVLWTTAWDHLGMLTAIKETEVLRLDPARFADIIHRSPPARSAALVYGRQFVASLNGMDERSLSDIMHRERKDSTKHKSGKQSKPLNGLSVK